MRVSSNLSSLAYEVAVASKLQATVREQGKQAVELIEAASLASTQLPPGVGESLNIKA